MFNLLVLSKKNLPSEKKLNRFLYIRNKKKVDIQKLRKYIDNLFWRLRFNEFTKGTAYFKTAICLAYINDSFLYDNKKLIKRLACFYRTNSKNIRNSIDNTLKSAFKYENLKYDIDFFEGYYDGRKVSFKYFLFFIIEYIERKMK